MRRIVVVLFLTLIILAACTSIDCPVQNKVYTNYNLYKSDGSVDTLTVDTLTIVTKVADGTLDTLLNQSTGITYFELDISHTQPEDEFFLFLNDTLGKAYKNLYKTMIKVNFKRHNGVPLYLNSGIKLSYLRPMQKELTGS